MYKNILVPLDGSELAECVFPHLKAIATGCSVAKVTLCRVVPPLHIYAGMETRFPAEEKKRIEDDEIRMAKDYLKKIAQQLTDAGVTVETVVLHGEVVEKLLEYASGNDVDFIVIATHGRSGISRWVWGSVADRILHSASMPILMVRAPKLELV